MKLLKDAAPGLAGAYAAGWVTTTEMYNKIPAGKDGDGKRAMYRYGAAGVAAIVTHFALAKL